MPTVKGREEVRAYIRQIPVALEAKVLRGAARAGARVIADEAKSRSISSEVAGAVKISTRQDVPGRVVAKVQVKGPNAYLAPWLEYGTDPHFITVDASQRQGIGTRRLNQAVREAEGDGSMVIGGKFVGDTVFHPGARPYPFLRPALDAKQAEAIAAAQAHIDGALAANGLNGPELPESDE
jgi:HK97 gp10 family phage protein